MPTTHLIYLPAEYVEGKRSYIKFSYTHPFNNQIVRKRLYFQLNRIKDLAQRRELALQHITRINQQLARGVIPYSSELSPSQILEAIILAKQIRDDSSLPIIERNKYISIINLLRSVLEKEAWTQLIYFEEQHKELFNAFVLKLIESKQYNYIVIHNIYKLFRTLILAIQDYLPSHILFGDAKNLLYDTKILDALAIAQKIKNTSDRRRTRDMVDSMVNIFTDFIEKKQWKMLPIGEFDKKKAMAFLDYGLLDRGIGPRTYNNYIERMRSMFTELVNRDYIDTNPFSGLKKRKEKGKIRRAFNEMERDLVAATVEEKDKWLMLGILLQYYCFIRPIELRRLRFNMFDFREGVIRLNGQITKNGDNEIVTIPDVLRPWLLEFDFSQWNQTWLIFGEKVQPHPWKCCGHNTLNYRHKQILKKLQKKGLLADIKGLSFYSWKDTGAMDLFKAKVNILEIMRQLRHKDLSVTQEYCQSLYMVNREIKHQKNSLLKRKLTKL